MHSTSLANQKKWTVLFYGGGANDLQSSIRKAWQQLEEQEASVDVDTFVQHFDSEGHCQEAHFEAGGKPTLLPRSESPVNSGDGETFKNFLLNGMKRFPASHYLVVVSSHGSGAGGVVSDQVAHDGLSLQEFGRGMESARVANGGRPIDMVMFDACQMGSAEMAMQLEGKAEVMVASLDNVGNSGYHLPTLVRQASQADDAAQLATAVVGNEDSQQKRTFRTLSAIDLRDLKPFRSAFAQWSGESSKLGEDELTRVRDLLADARRNSNAPETQSTFDSIAEDLLSQYPVDVGLLKSWIAGTRTGPGIAIAPFLRSLLDSESIMMANPSLQRSSQALLGAHDNLILAQRSTDGTAGMTIHAPLENVAGPLYRQDDGPLPDLDETGWETAYDAVLPEGQTLPHKPTWLETELAPMLPNWEQ
ncbi:MAG: hypothetical protein KC800_08425 [Candidatus Eremiobacteraeota bacterium]|nr:hypothetical protein [Candidatus Eremiobacteraeota bacterium]